MSVEWNGEAVLAAVEQAVMRGVVRGTEGVLEEGTSLILDTPKTGRVYRRRSVEHRASAPGQPPASDTGRLVQSGRTDYEPPVLTGTVTWSTDYAEYLEHGTTKMDPRPFARPALANRKEEIEADIADEVGAVLR